MQQVPGSRQVHALALQTRGDVIEERCQMLRHLGLLLVEGFFLGQQFGSHHQTIQRTVVVRRAKPGAKTQYVAGQGRRIGRMEMRGIGQQDSGERTCGAQMAEVAFAVVWIRRVQVRVRGVRAAHVPDVEFANLGSFFELAGAARQKRKRAGGARGMTQAQLG
ncbi:hypothetical protein D3C76_1110690 [compost metagenome]